MRIRKVPTNIQIKVIKWFDYLWLTQAIIGHSKKSYGLLPLSYSDNYYIFKVIKLLLPLAHSGNYWTFEAIKWFDYLWLTQAIIGHSKQSNGLITFGSPMQSWDIKSNQMVCLPLAHSGNYWTFKAIKWFDYLWLSQTIMGYSKQTKVLITFGSLRQLLDTQSNQMV
jgi:hypothetical protein